MSYCLVHCVDSSFPKRWRIGLESIFNEWFPVTSPGGVLDLSCDLSRLEQLGRARSLQHNIVRTLEIGNISNVALLNHSNCKAYRDEQKIFFALEEQKEEKTFHIGQLHKAKTMLKQYILPDMVIETYYLDHRTGLIEQISLVA